MCVLPLFPGLLEAWLVLTSIKYHGNLYILIPLNQRLALTRLRATGPGLRQMQFMLLTYCFHLLRVTKGARNPHFQVVVAHVSLVCSQDSFGPPLRMYGRHRMQFDNERLDLLSLEIWSFAFFTCHMKLTQSTALEQKRFDLRSLSSTLCIKPLVIASFVHNNCCILIPSRKINIILINLG